MKDTTRANGTRKMSDAEIAKIRAALKGEGVPVYPDRILANPATYEPLHPAHRKRKDDKAGQTQT
jgi:hypothetical protein